jgi:uncharacterized protein
MSRYLNKSLAAESRRGRVDRVVELLEKGADINRLGSDGFTPLMRAAYSGFGALLRMLLNRGADPNVTAKDGASALFWACVQGHEAEALALINAGANVNAFRDAKNDGDYSVLHVAIGHSSKTVVTALVLAGASLDRRYLKMDAIQFAQRFRPQFVPLIARMERPVLRRRH